MARLAKMKPASARTHAGRRPRQHTSDRNKAAADSSAIQTRKAVSEVLARVTGAASRPTPCPWTGGRKTPEAWALVLAM